MEWTPLVATAQPNNPHLSAILSSSPADTSPLAYDRKRMNIIQWLPQAEKTVDGGWVEYDPKQDSLFKMTPGKLFWLADIGRQRSATAARLYRPLQTPWLFNSIKMDGPIFQFLSDSTNMLEISSMPAGKCASPPSIRLKSIHWRCQWIKSGRTYATNAVYLREIPDTSVGSPTDTLIGGKALSIFNGYAKNIALLIPPTSVSTSSLTGDTSVLKRRKIATASGASPWSVKIGVFSHDTEFCSSMFCASVPSNNIPRFYPQSPSLSAIRAAIIAPRII